jgi:hypothetical protein
MKKRIILPIILLLICSFVFASNKPNGKEARNMLDAAATAMGGLEKLRALKGLQLEAIGHWNLLEQSERPEGPWLVTYDQITEWRDLDHSRVRQTSKARRPDSPEWSNNFNLIVADGVAMGETDGRQFPASMAQVQDAEEWLALSPERVLLTALNASDLHSEPDTILQNVPHHVVTFTWKDAPVRLFLNTNTSLPTAVELIRPLPYDMFWSVWGNFTSRTYFSFWTLERNGLRYPHQWDIVRNGQPYRTLTITTLKQNPVMPNDAFTIADEVKKGFASQGMLKVKDWDLGLPNRPAQELAKDNVQIPGRWNVALIKQTDGVVILEAPISSWYSAKVIAEVEKRFPGTPIKAVISTSDSWPHFAGVREYAARGIPIYILDVNQPIIKRLIDAPYQTYPDSLAHSPRKPDFKIVSSKTIIGSGDNRLEVYPIRTESGERMLMVYAPAHHLLYGSDLIQRLPTGEFFMPQYLSELTEAANREHLVVEKVFAMHSLVLNWSTIQDAINKASAP